MKLFSSNKNKNYPGFSFMEMMIVIAIIGILSTISVISFNKIRGLAIINASADEVFSAIKMAKGYALQGKMPDTSSSVCGVGSICGYGFMFTSATQYEVFYYYNCPGGNLGPLNCSAPTTATKVTIDTQDLKTGVTLGSPLPLTSTNSTIYFNIPWGTVVSTPYRNYRLDYNGMKKRVTVDTNGLIQEL